MDLDQLALDQDVSKTIDFLNRYPEQIADLYKLYILFPEFSEDFDFFAKQFLLQKLPESEIPDLKDIEELFKLYPDLFGRHKSKKLGGMSDFFDNHIQEEAYEKLGTPRNKIDSPGVGSLNLDDGKAVLKQYLLQRRKVNTTRL